MSAPAGRTPDEDSEGTPAAGAPLPEQVRSRVVALAAEALGSLSPEQLPAPLKRVAGFAPARRAKLAGNQIAGVLENDDGFRERVGIQLRVQYADLARALESGTVPPAADPVQTAALAYLLRPEGWEELVAGAGGVAESERAAARVERAEQQSARARSQAEEATARLRESRQQARDQAAEHKRENADLRRRLGDARTRAREAEGQAAQARASTESATAQAREAEASAQAEVRRLQARVEHLEAERAAGRRTEREGREAGTVRARLLLETLLGAAQGLRRELALPPVGGAPGEDVEADVRGRGAEPEGRRASSGVGSLAPEDPALLEQLLAMPRARLVVDGYNVTKAVWGETSLEVQRDRLLAGIAPLVARSGVETTVVFDAAETTTRPPVSAPRGVRVLFSPAGVIADDVIRELVAAEPPGRPVVVVTSDREVVTDVTRAGAWAVASAALVAMLTRG